MTKKGLKNAGCKCTWAIFILSDSAFIFIIAINGHFSNSCKPIMYCFVINMLLGKHKMERVVVIRKTVLLRPFGAEA